MFLRYFIGLFLAVFAVMVLARKGTAEVAEGYNTIELMNKIQSSLPESLRVINELKVQTPPKAVGERQRFKHPVYHFKENGRGLVSLQGKNSFIPVVEYIETMCVKIIKGNAYIFIEVGYDNKFDEEVQDVAESFPKERKRIHKFLGKPSFDVDKDPAVYFIISPTVFSYDRPGVSAKISLTDINLSFPNSNGGEIIYVKPYANGGINIRDYIGFEYAHVLSVSHDWGDQLWMHEGLGYATVRVLGYGLEPNRRLIPDKFLSWEGTPEDHVSVCYFFLFLYDRYGLEAIRKMFLDSRHGKESISYVAGKSWQEVWEEYKEFLERGPVFTRKPP